MGKLLFWLGLNPDEDEGAAVFRLIGSETDHLPLGDERQYWEPTALATKDIEIQSAEMWARPFGLVSCQRLIDRFATERRMA